MSYRSAKVRTQSQRALARSGGKQLEVKPWNLEVDWLRQVKPEAMRGKQLNILGTQSQSKPVPK